MANANKDDERGSESTSNQGGNSGHGGEDPDHGKGNPGPGGGGGPGHGDHQKFEIQIDRAKYEVSKSIMTGAELRRVPPDGIPADRDLFEVVPGAPDKKITDTDRVEIRNGKRFFTAPGQINPGAL